MTIDDVFVGQIEGAVFFSPDFEFDEMIKAHANRISAEILSKQTVSNFDMQIDENTIVVELGENGRTKLNIDNDSIRYRFPATKIAAIRKGDGALSEYVGLIEKIADKIKPGFRRLTYGMNLIFAIPYEMPGHNERHFLRLLNDQIFGQNAFVRPSNDFRFGLDFSRTIKDGMLLNLTVKNRGIHLTLSTDFRWSPEGKPATLENFMTSCFEGQYFDWLNDFLKHMTNGYEGVDLQFLRTNNEHG